MPLKQMFKVLIVMYVYHKQIGIILIFKITNNNVAFCNCILLMMRVAYVAALL